MSEIPWRHRRGVFDLETRGVIMGILNVTPDSFSDGGRYATLEQATTHAMEMVAEGAQIIDVGGESTRPGAEIVPADVEAARVIPIIRALRDASDVVISIDTSKATVAEEALEAGADIINDVTGFTGDPRMLEVAVKWSAGVVLMHMRGNPRTMQNEPRYDDVVREVGEFLAHQMAAAVASGIDPMAIALDPGIGFGKTPEHNWRLLEHCGTFGIGKRPVLIGASRKSFLRECSTSHDPLDRLWAGVAVTSLCRERGARIFRVHDVRPHRDALRMSEAILHGVP